MHNRTVPDESDTALLFVDRGLVRADHAPSGSQAQRRAYARSRAARWARWSSFPVVLIGVPVAMLVAASAGPVLWLTVPLVLLAAGVLVGALTRAARVAHATAGMPVPIEISGSVATAMRSILAMAAAIGRQRPLRRSRAVAEGLVLLRRWSRTGDELRAAWLRGDVVVWHEHARTLVEAGPRAERVRDDVEAGS